MSYLPDIYKEFQQKYPDIASGYGVLAETIHQSGSLDVKTRRLVKLGIAMGQSSEGAVKSHTRRALSEGIAPEELRHAVLMAFTTAGFPTMIAAMKWVEEVIEKSE